MHTRNLRHILGGALLVVLATGSMPSFAASESGGKPWFKRMFSRTPVPRTAEAYLARATDAEREGRTKQALEDYRTIVQRWPDSDQAAEAQFGRARMLQERGDILKAFTAYTRLAEQHPGEYPEGDVLERELQIAEKLSRSRKNKWFFGGVATPERAIPYLDRIIAQGPETDQAAAAKYMTGTIYERRKDYPRAVASYEKVVKDHPNAPVAEAAMFAAGRGLYFMSRDNPDDDLQANRAWKALERFTETYPDSAQAAEARVYLDTLGAQREKDAMVDTIKTYDKAHGRKLLSFRARPVKGTPEEEFAFAETLRQSGKTGKAGKQYRALAVRWPDSPQAPKALYQHARILDENGESDEAFKGYAYLAEHYPDGYDREAVLDRMLTIASGLLEERKRRFWFDSAGDPAGAVLKLETLLPLAADWTRRDQVLFDLGEGYARTDQPALAVLAYDDLLNNHAGSALAEQAAFARAYALYLVSRKHDEDEQAVDAAWTALSNFLHDYPDSPLLDRAAGYRETLGGARKSMETVRDEQAYEEEHHARDWLGFLPWRKTKTAEAYLDRANRYSDRGRYGKAADLYRAIVKRWPDAPEAPQAQYAYARILDRKGSYKKAFEEFSYLMSRYAGRVPHDEILERMFGIAKHLMETRKGAFLFFDGFAAPERAIPLFEAIIEYGPNWERAPEVQYLIGRAHDMVRQTEMAIAAYTTTLYKYPDSEFAERASFAKAYDLYLLTEESPNDEQLADAAWAALTMYLNSYPKAENAPEALEYRKALYRRRAKAAYDKAVFYDRLARNPKAALVAYRRFIEQYPHSGWTTLAEIRIQELSSELE